jgi:hypothetical protein
VLLITPFVATPHIPDGNGNLAYAPTPMVGSVLPVPSTRGVVLDKPKNKDNCGKSDLPTIAETSEFL